MAHYDVAIVGGGPAGSAAAITLARLGRHVVLADSSPAERFRVGEGFPPSARSLLSDLQILDEFLAAGHRPSYGNVSVWGDAVPRTDDFIGHLHGQGYQLDRARFDQQLRDAARQAGAAVYESSRLTLQAHANDGFQLRLNATDNLSSRWLIDAGGRPAVLARQLGAQRLVDDRLGAFFLLLHSQQGSDRDGRTLVEAVENGWWYSVLLPSGRRLVTFLGDLDLLDRQSLLGAEGLWQTLAHTQVLSSLCREHAYQPEGPAQGRDASSGHLAQSQGNGWAAVGDAALSFDPLSSQGIAMALYSGQACAQAVHSALQGDCQALTRYADLQARIYHAYLDNRRAFYAMEQRWSGSAFWQRRHLMIKATEALQ